MGLILGPKCGTGWSYNFEASAAHRGRFRLTVGIEPIASSLNLDHILKRHHITGICSFAMNVPLEGGDCKYPQTGRLK